MSDTPTLTAFLYIAIPVLLISGSAAVYEIWSHWKARTKRLAEEAAKHAPPPTKIELTEGELKEVSDGVIMQRKKGKLILYTVDGGYNPFLRAGLWLCFFISLVLVVSVGIAFFVGTVDIGGPTGFVILAIAGVGVLNVVFGMLLSIFGKR